MCSGIGRRAETGGWRRGGGGGGVGGGVVGAECFR